jgi:cytosine/adenosine deaminase-related metal-dependent hydrolase
MTWDVTCKGGCISNIKAHIHSDEVIADERFLTPGLCHPHIHLDKCFILSHPKFADLEIHKGDFAEAMELTSRCHL